MADQNPWQFDHAMYSCSVGWRVKRSKSQGHKLSLSA